MDRFEQQPIRKKRVKVKIKVMDEVRDKPSEQEEPKWQVVLYNDDINFYGDVISAVQQAIKCSLEIAEKVVFDAHNKGKASCFIGSHTQCEQVYSVLSSWKLTSEIQEL